MPSSASQLALLETTMAAAALRLNLAPKEFKRVTAQVMTALARCQAVLRRRALASDGCFAWELVSHHNCVIARVRDNEVWIWQEYGLLGHEVNGRCELRADAADWLTYIGQCRYQTASDTPPC